VKQTTEDAVTYVANVGRPGGGLDLYLDAEEAEQFQANPDLFTAAYLGFESAQQYREWVRLDGAPLCGGLTKAGHVCGNSSRGYQLDADEWRARHRVDRCHHHRRTQRSNVIYLDSHPAFRGRRNCPVTAA
jgi:hypothetical protein